MSKEWGRKTLLRIWTSHVNILLWEYDKLKDQGMGIVSYTSWSLEAARVQSMQGTGLSPKMLVKSWNGLKPQEYLVHVCSVGSDTLRPCGLQSDKLLSVWFPSQ